MRPLATEEVRFPSWLLAITSKARLMVSPRFAIGGSPGGVSSYSSRIFRLVLPILLVLISTTSAFSQSETKVWFYNQASVTVNVVTDVGDLPTRKNFSLPSGESASVSVGSGSLLWCSYKDSNPCTPDKKAKSGDKVNLK